MSKFHRKKTGRVAVVVAQFPILCRLAVESLLGEGVTKVYAVTQTTANKAGWIEELDKKVVPIQLDLSSPSDIKAAAIRCQDVNLLFNLAPAVSSIGRSQTLNKTWAVGLNLAFIPVIAGNGGGLIINALPQAPQLRLQLDAIGGRALERRNIDLYFKALNADLLFFNLSEQQIRCLLTSLLHEAGKKTTKEPAAV